MSLAQEKKSSLARLTALKERENLSIDGVLDSFRSLEELSVDPQRVPSRSGQGYLIPREDIVKSSESSSQDLLSCSPQRVIAHQISLSSIMQGE